LIFSPSALICGAIEKKIEMGSRDDDG